MKTDPADFNHVPDHLSLRALDRRANRGSGPIFDEHDLPVYQDYINRLERLGIAVEAESHWLNAVSAFMTPEVVEQLQSLPFIKKIQIVRSFSVQPPGKGKIPEITRIASETDHQLDYGLSYMQSQMNRIPEVHDLGLSGKRILIGLLDTGFDYRDRLVFEKTDIIAEHDFIQDDGDTQNDSTEFELQDDHGAMVLSVIGGYHPGELIGPAYKAQYALAKTEVRQSESRIEEDYWVMGVEWLESIGVDIISSSLGYNRFDDGFSYAYSDMDGNTCVTTIAADRAAARGVAVFTSAGNEFKDSWKYIMSPADGDSVIAVGAVNFEGKHAYFSSVGPTSDGRIKPDIMAVGLSALCVNPKTEETGYLWANGTSFSCPIVAGAAALILEARPELTPMQLREAFTMTASQSSTPDSLLGYGIADAWQALFYHGMVFTDFRIGIQPGQPYRTIEMKCISNTGVDPDMVNIQYRDSSQDFFSEGRMVQTDPEAPFKYAGLLPGEINLQKLQFYFTAVDTCGTVHTGPLEAPASYYSLSDTSGQSVAVNLEIPETFHLFQNYPNPFNYSTIISFRMEKGDRVLLQLFNLSGQHVKTLLDERMNSGKNSIIWNGLDERGRSVGSGMYICRLRIYGQSQTRKLILLK